MNLSPHFTLEAFTASDTAARLAIDNSAPAALIQRLRYTTNMLEVVRDDVLHGLPVLISSGYRCAALEHVLCAHAFALWCSAHRKPMADPASWKEYLSRKAHPQGLACDFTCPQFGSPLKICYAIASSDIDFEQLIWEHTWVHLAFPAQGAGPGKREKLTLLANGAYAQGIVESQDPRRAA